MIRFLAFNEIVELHRLLLEQSGGMDGVRDAGGLDSAIAQPRIGHQIGLGIADAVSR